MFSPYHPPLDSVATWKWCVGRRKKIWTCIGTWCSFDRRVVEELEQSRQLVVPGWHLVWYTNAFLSSQNCWVSWKCLKYDMSSIWVVWSVCLFVELECVLVAALSFDQCLTHLLVLLTVRGIYTMCLYCPLELTGYWQIGVWSACPMQHVQSQLWRALTQVWFH